MSTSRKKKGEAVIKTFGISIDPEDIAFINFLYERRHLATVPGTCGREPAYLAESDELEEAIIKTLDRIRARDGTKISREVADRWIEAIEIAMTARRPRGSTKANGAHA